MPPIWDLACIPGMCPDQESNLQVFGLQDVGQPTEPCQSGPFFVSLILSIYTSIFSWSISEVYLISFSKANYPFISTFPCHFAFGISVANGIPYGCFLVYTGKFVYSYLLWLLMYLNLFLPYYFLHSMSCISMPYCFFFFGVFFLTFKSTDRAF